MQPVKQLKYYVEFDSESSELPDVSNLKIFSHVPRPLFLNLLTIL